MDGKREHPSQMLHTFRAPFLIRVNNGFGIRPSLEDMAAFPQLLEECREVVNLTVEDDPHSVIFVGQRLVAAGHVNNAQSAKAKSHVAPSVLAAVVWPAMHHDSGHGSQHFRINRVLTRNVNNTGYTTHKTYQLRPTVPLPPAGGIKELEISVGEMPTDFNAFRAGGSRPPRPESPPSARHCPPS